MTSKHDELETLREDLAELRSEVRALLDTLGKTGSDAAGAVNGKTRRFANEIEHTLEKLAGKAYGKAAKEGQRYLDGLEDTVSERPFSSVMIALAAGVMLGRFLDRSPGSR